MEFIEKLARAHGTGGWQTLDDMVRFGKAVIAAHTEKLLAEVEMPEPVGQRLVRADDIVAFDTDPPTEYEKSVGWKPIFTLDQLQQYAASAALNARVKALGEAIEIHDEYGDCQSRLSDVFKALKGEI